MRRVTLGVAALLCFLAAPFSCTVLSAPKDLDERVDQIVSRLRRPTPDELWAAQRQLAQLGADAVPILKSRIAKARPAGTLAMAKALCALDHAKDAVEPLVGLVRSKRHPAYGAIAAAVLGASARDVPATERHLLSLVDDEALPLEVRREVARSLWTAATTEESLKRANAALRRHLTQAKDPSTRRQCALALAQIDDFNPPVDAILKELQDEPTVRGRLASTLLETNNLRSLLIRPKNREGSLNDRLLTEVKALIQRFHVEAPLPDHELVNAAARGMTHALQSGDHPDRHSAFFDEKDWQKFREHISGHYGGIGAVVQFAKHFDTGELPVFTVVRPNYEGPAYAAGIRSYDRVVEVSGQPTAVKNIDEVKTRLKEVVDTLRGKPDTPVEITVTSPGSKDRRKITLKRAEIQMPSVRSHLLPAKIGYVRLSNFGQQTADDLGKALRKLEKEGMAALVLDLRNNPGGQLAAAVQITDKFLKHNKLIVYTEGRNKRIAKREEFRTKDPTTHPDYPIVVLINGHSASASEIVSGALQDHKRATLVGTTTFGKGSVQKLFPLRSTAMRSGLKLTIAKYYLPSGRSIHGKGVEPDIEAKFEPTFTAKDFEHLRETGAFYRYSASRFAKHKALFAKLADFDGLAAKRYPDFDAWHKGLAEEIGRDKARRLLRAWLRILVADDRGEQFACDIEEDNQLQRAILELAGRIEAIDPKQIPEYRVFADREPKKAEAKAATASPKKPE